MQVMVWTRMAWQIAARFVFQIDRSLWQVQLNAVAALKLGMDLKISMRISVGIALNEIAGVVGSSVFWLDDDIVGMLGFGQA